MGTAEESKQRDVDDDITTTTTTAAVFAKSAIGSISIRRPREALVAWAPDEIFAAVPPLLAGLCSSSSQKEHDSYGGNSDKGDDVNLSFMSPHVHIRETLINRLNISYFESKHLVTFAENLFQGGPSRQQEETLPPPEWIASFLLCLNNCLAREAVTAAAAADSYYNVDEHHHQPYHLSSVFKAVKTTEEVSILRRTFLRLGAKEFSPESVILGHLLPKMASFSSSLLSSSRSTSTSASSPSLSKAELLQATAFIRKFFPRLKATENGNRILEKLGQVMVVLTSKDEIVSLEDPEKVLFQPPTADQVLRACSSSKVEYHILSGEYLQASDKDTNDHCSNSSNVKWREFFQRFGVCPFLRVVPMRKKKQKQQQQHKHQRLRKKKKKKKSGVDIDGSEILVYCPDFNEIVASIGTMISSLTVDGSKISSLKGVKKKKKKKEEEEGTTERIKMIQIRDRTMRLLFFGFLSNWDTYYKRFRSKGLIKQLQRHRWLPSVHDMKSNGDSITNLFCRPYYALYRPRELFVDTPHTRSIVWRLARLLDVDTRSFTGDYDDADDDDDGHGRIKANRKKVRRKKNNRGDKKNQKNSRGRKIQSSSSSSPSFSASLPSIPLWRLAGWPSSSSVSLSSSGLASSDDGKKEKQEKEKEGGRRDHKQEEDERVSAYLRDLGIKGTGIESSMGGKVSPFEFADLLLKMQDEEAKRPGTTCASIAQMLQGYQLISNCYDDCSVRSLDNEGGGRRGGGGAHGGIIFHHGNKEIRGEGSFVASSSPSSSSSASCSNAILHFGKIPIFIPAAPPTNAYSPEKGSFYCQTACVWEDSSGVLDSCSAMFFTEEEGKKGEEERGVRSASNQTIRIPRVLCQYYQPMSDARKALGFTKHSIAVDPSPFTFVHAMEKITEILPAKKAAPKVFRLVAALGRISRGDSSSSSSRRRAHGEDHKHQGDWIQELKQKQIFPTFTHRYVTPSSQDGLIYSLDTPAVHKLQQKQHQQDSKNNMMLLLSMLRSKHPDLPLIIVPSSMSRRRTTSKQSQHLRRRSKDTIVQVVDAVANKEEEEEEDIISCLKLLGGISLWDLVEDVPIIRSSSSSSSSSSGKNAVEKRGFPPPPTAAASGASNGEEESSLLPLNLLSTTPSDRYLLAKLVRFVQLFLHNKHQEIYRRCGLLVSRRLQRLRILSVDGNMSKRPCFRGCYGLEEGGEDCVVVIYKDTIYAKIPLDGADSQAIDSFVRAFLREFSRCVAKIIGAHTVQEKVDDDGEIYGGDEKRKRRQGSSKRATMSAATYDCFKESELHLFLQYVINRRDFQQLSTKMTISSSEYHHNSIPGLMIVNDDTGRKGKKTVKNPSDALSSSPLASRRSSTSNPRCCYYRLREDDLKNLRDAQIKYIISEDENDDDDDDEHIWKVILDSSVDATDYHHHDTEEEEIYNNYNNMSSAGPVAINHNGGGDDDGDHDNVFSRLTDGENIKEKGATGSTITPLSANEIRTKLRTLGLPSFGSLRDMQQRLEDDSSSYRTRTRRQYHDHGHDDDDDGREDDLLSHYKTSKISWLTIGGMGTASSSSSCSEQVRRRIGDWGERFVFEHLKQRYGDTAKVQWINEEGETGYPYDITVRDLTGNKLFIEVKTTVTSSFSFPISWNELIFAAENSRKYQKENEFTMISIIATFYIRYIV
eukprot:jgi/Bigna1/91527/estExt_fgenesh1_pg.C_1040037